MQLGDTLEKHFRINDTQKKALGRLGLSTIYDLLHHFPVRYSSMSEIKLIRDAKHGETVTLYGKLEKLKTKKSFRGKTPMGEAVLTDMTGDTVKIMWFHQVFIVKQFTEGETVKLTGKITESKYGLSLTNPEIEHVPELPIDRHDSLFTGQKDVHEFGYPIYRESRGITSKWFYHALRKIFNTLEEIALVDPLPIHVLEQYNLPSLHKALLWMHMPQKKDHADAARKRFAFQEVFLIQVARKQSRHEFEKNFSYILDLDQEKIQSFIDRFPFTPTDAQSRTIESALADMKKEHPMSRLVEGDVGSGKTFVAATLAYAVTQNRPRKAGGGKQNYGALQVAYMAPTEVLAAQLFENFIQYFRGTGTQIALITGSGCRKFPSKVASSTHNWTDISKTQVLKWIASGEIPIIIGTHALVSKKVIFKDLGLVIIDEQHRFGTNQRRALARKDNLVPHYLSMTATPIPRTLALTIYGDLDLSIIDTMPAGRKPVITEIVSETKRPTAYENMRQELIAGRQLYIICPRISESDLPAGQAGPDEEQKLQLKSVKAEAERLKKDIFPEFRIDIMHSKMTKIQKEDVMQQFYNHDIDILVSTSVIEVGVNVPNATMIIIEGAERFGLAQLHQLRGRVLRSNHQAYCYLFTSDRTTSSDTTIKRLQALQKSTSGFELAEMDMQLRGIGDLAGQKQWGISDIGMEAIKNIKMVEAARSEAQAIISKDPELKKYPELDRVLRHKNFEVHFE